MVPILILQKFTTLKQVKPISETLVLKLKKSWNAVKLKRYFTYMNVLYNQKAIEGFGSENVQ
jgi:hypothetical protein